MAADGKENLPLFQLLAVEAGALAGVHLGSPAAAAVVRDLNPGHGMIVAPASHHRPCGGGSKSRHHTVLLQFQRNQVSIGGAAGLVVDDGGTVPPIAGELVGADQQQ